MGKLNFQHPLLQSSVSHDPSQIIHADFGFQLLSIIIESSKEQQIYDTEIFSSIINVFTTLDHFIVSLLKMYLYFTIRLIS